MQAATGNGNAVSSNNVKPGRGEASSYEQRYKSKKEQTSTQKPAPEKQVQYKPDLNFKKKPSQSDLQSG